MAEETIDYDQVPGTELLVDVDKSLNITHAGAGTSDIVLIPQPTPCGGDPLKWPTWKKYYQLFLVALYACAFSFGENTLGAAWTTISDETGVSLTNMNGGSALNYLLLGFVNIWWIPTANKIGRRFVFLTTTLLCMCAGVWLGKFNDTGQWMASMILNGLGTSAYQAVIQLSVFDMFFVHDRGRMLSVYLFGQQLGSILGLITGGSIADSIGWRWSQYIVAIVDAGVLVLLFFTFEETLFPRFLFSSNQQNPPLPTTHDDSGESGKLSMDGKKESNMVHKVESRNASGFVDEFPKRTYLQTLSLWVSYPQNKTTFFQYFRRPFFLWAFPNVVIAGFIFAFGCTAGIVSFNTISEIMTNPPYNWSTTATGMIFFAALVGNFIGWGTGVLSDELVIRLARRNGGVKEPEMRLYMLVVCFIYAAVGYMLYGWGAQKGLHWITIAIGICGMIAHQVSACTIATAYAMECFPGISGELVVVLAMCSSLVNFAISYSVQPFINAVGYGWTFIFFGFCVLLSMVAAIPMVIYGKRWRKWKAPRYYRFLQEVSRTD